MHIELESINTYWDQLNNKRNRSCDGLKKTIETSA